MCVCLYVGMYMWGSAGKVRRAPDPLEMELVAVVIHHMGAETPTQVLWKSSKSS